MFRSECQLSTFYVHKLYYCVTHLFGVVKATHDISMVYEILTIFEESDD